jgi:hypothetical protein
MNQVHSRMGLTHTAQMALRGALLENQAGQFVRASVETGTAALASAAEGISGDLLQIVRDPSEPGGLPDCLGQLVAFARSVLRPASGFPSFR